MSQPVNKVAYKEINNHSQGRDGAKVKVIPGPAKGKTSGNPTQKGGIFRPTKGAY